MTKKPETASFTRGTKKYETIGNDEIGKIVIERKGSLTPLEKGDLETLLDKAGISKAFGQKEIIKISERIATETKNSLMTVMTGIESREIEFLDRLTDEEIKKIFGQIKTVNERTQAAEIENSIYGCVLLRSRIEEFQAAIPENLLDPDHELFLPYPLLEGVAEFCYRELHHWKEKKNLDQDDLKSLS